CAPFGFVSVERNHHGPRCARGPHHARPHSVCLSVYPAHPVWHSRRAFAQARGERMDSRHDQRCTVATQRAARKRVTKTKNGRLVSRRPLEKKRSLLVATARRRSWRPSTRALHCYAS